MTKKSQWVRIQRVTCDLCDRTARYTHPLGGIRCDKCPKPEAPANPRKYTCPECLDQAFWCATCGGR